MTEDQLSRLIQSLMSTSITEMSRKSFAKCTSRFNGERNYDRVEEFIAAITIFKKIENIGDDDALEGLGLLLIDTASTWWQGVKQEAKTWSSALNLIRAAFAPKKQPHEIYVDLFSSHQRDREPIDDFLCAKRALLAQLPSKRHKEEEQIDLIYGLLNTEMKRQVPRSDVKTFSDLLTKCRHFENLREPLSSDKDPETVNKPRQKRCTFCTKRGHAIEECRKRAAAESKASNVAEPIKCYGCGAQGVYRSNCTNCKNQETPPKPVHFYSMVPTPIQGGVKIPTIEVSINDWAGYAYLDSAARTSIAGAKLYKMMVTAGATFTESAANINLADGSSKMLTLLSTTTIITIGDRNLPITMVAIPEAEETHFLESAGIVLNLPQRCWSFIDNPKKHYQFLQLRTEAVMTEKSVSKHLAMKMDFMDSCTNEEETKEVSQFMKWARELAILSPMPETPPDTAQASPPKIRKWNPIKLDSPPPIVRPREPWAENEDIVRRKDPRVNYIPINPTQLYSLDVSFHNNVDILLRDEEGTQLTLPERKQLNELLIEYKHIFAEHGEPTSYAVHKIDTGDHQPIAIKPYRMSPLRQQQLKGKIDDMLYNDIIEECDSPWASPVILVAKENNDVRVCVDYRRLNEITTPDRYPLPRMDDLLHQAKAMPFMSTLDLRSGYWQIKVDTADQDQTAFVSPFGTYKFKRMPFGLRNAPATFQRLMDRLIRSMKSNCALAFLDDLHVRSISFSQHLEDLREIFKKLEEYNLRANRKKCNFGRSEIKYLGHLIVPEGLKADPEKISAIANRPAPKNEKQLVSFIQTASWYRRFIHNYAEISRPLTKLTKKTEPWQWCIEQERAFQQIKTALTTAPILRQANHHLPFVLKTDASQYAIGAALLQGEGENEHPVEYASRLLNNAERNYSVTEKEALAIVWAISRFRGYIEGTKFITITDHQPLKWLMSLKTPTGRLARWALQLQPYEFEIQYMPGRTNVLADLLSRPPCENHTDDCMICLIEVELPKRDEKSIREEQMKDQEISNIISSLEKDVEKEDHVEWLKKGYVMHRGVLYRYTPDQEDDNAKLVIPKHEREDILKSCHDIPIAGHLGVDRTTYRITGNYYWNGLRKDVIKYVKSCIECQRYKPTNQKPAGLYQSTANNQRFEVLSIDLFGPLPKAPTNEKWIFIVEDTASRWIEIFAIKEATATVCATILLNQIFLRYGLPRKISSDNGVQFISAVMQKLTYCLGIQHIFSPVYHPEPNMVERRNRDMKTQIAIMVKNQHNVWPTALPAIQFAINTAVCQSTGFTPAYLTFGRELRTPCDLTHDLSTVIRSENFVHEITPTLKKLADDLKIAKENVEKAQENNRLAANKKRRPDPGYKVGDLVLITTHPISNQEKNYTAKFAPRRDGPYQILNKISSTIYEVCSPEAPNTPIGKFHTSAITKFEKRTTDDKLPSPMNAIKRRGRPKKITN
ncbi:unnamed protein product [Plutella xylostella]|uniref:RNA-directed DNA polymerase n=1 Tax=Plutella xylostella TaxID=51655 RepID=A0A8S4DC23_PLUXY|nr:unnamed protein product [Plutella xylostella]